MEKNNTTSDLPVSENLDDALKGLETVSSFIEKNIKDERIMGAVALVARKGKIIHFEASGVSDAEENKPMSLDAIFRVYSMTKPVTSVAVMMLAEEGKLQLDEPVSRLKVTGNTFFYSVPLLWNNTVSPSQAEAPSVDSFKRYFRRN